MTPIGKLRQVGLFQRILQSLNPSLSKQALVVKPFRVMMWEFLGMIKRKSMRNEN